MTSSDVSHEAHAEELYRAFSERHRIDPLTTETDLDVADAYRIQEDVMDRILGEAGDPLGYKLGLVSAAKQEQLGIDEPIFCTVPEQFLTSRELAVEDLMEPRLEAEIGLVLDGPIEPPVSASEVLVQTGKVVPVIEILESRFNEWEIPTAQDVIADITSGCNVILGERVRDVSDVDLPMEGIRVTQNGEQVGTGLGADIMGHPARGVAWLAERLEDRGASLGAGDLVMTGGITAAVDIERGDLFRVEFSSLGTMEIVAK